METFQLGVECQEVHGKVNCNIKTRMNERGGNGGCSCDVDGVSDMA